MDSFKIGPKTWQAFRQNLASAKHHDQTADSQRLEAHAKPIVASDASDVIEMGECTQTIQTSCNRAAHHSVVWWLAIWSQINLPSMQQPAVPHEEGQSCMRTMFVFLKSAKMEHCQRHKLLGHGSYSTPPAISSPAYNLALTPTLRKSMVAMVLSSPPMFTAMPRLGTRFI